MHVVHRFAATLALLTVSVSMAHAEKLRVCGRTGIVHEGEVANGRFKQTWTWDASKSKGVPAAFVNKLTQIDDCKASADGKEMLISSSRGGIAIVAYPSGKTLFYAAVPNAHSIDVLPNGIVAAASSTHPQGNRLILFDRNTPDKEIYSLPIEAAHGVTWDAGRNVLWALCDTELLKLTVKRTGPQSVDVQVVKRYTWGGRGGHDLVVSHDGSRFIITTVPKVIVFDIASEKFSDFAPLKGMRDIKSVTFARGTEQLAYTQANGGGEWWTRKVHLREGQKDIAVPLEFEIYKTRWAQR